MDPRALFLTLTWPKRGGIAVFPIIPSGTRNSSSNLPGKGTAEGPNRRPNRVIVAKIHENNSEEEEGDFMGSSLAEEGGDTVFSNVAVLMSGRISDSPGELGDPKSVVGSMIGTVRGPEDQTNGEGGQADSLTPVGSLGRNAALENLR